MSGSCYACSKRYGFFTKEVGCPNCGFSFCTKCLKKTIAVPKCNNEERKVCLSCFEKLSIQKSVQASLEQQQQNPLKVAPSSSLLDAPFPDEDKLPDIDDEIKKRLEVVKQPTNDLDKDFSDRGMAERLANIKGVPHKEYDHSAMLNAVDKRTDNEKANELVAQFMQEVSLDDAVNDSYEDPIKSIERRLAALKGSPTEQTSQAAGSSEQPHEDEEMLAKKLVTKYLDEAALPDSELTPEEKEFVNSVKPGENTEELPWCTVCNEDATIRCIGCDGDLFCKGCFNEIHDDDEYRAHRTKKFIPKETQPQ
ncbi:abscission/NoCut checkpoint regulator isoform X2 [Sitodiplosis mosellana]|uniref:abscission/NoCut checkpoint regulator isoform X2 n=1 Tax=Sitodiplosis mosellana TaxID=263140 RepID=UPI0024443A07|nr:abscission/NoCut checkpoint regulator isoform X2 [Sitodiplosis mosellana]